MISCICIFTQFLHILCAKPERKYIFDAEYRKQLKELCSQYDWAKKEQKRIVSYADKIAKIKDEALWYSIPSQMVPRSLFVNREWGCPKCGKKIFRMGYYPWIKCHGEWKVQCPICKEKYPKNDFYKYYLSGIDKKGNFNPDLADKSLLYNVEHPDPKDPLHKFGVDDGVGYLTKDGKHYRFIGHYNMFSNWYSGGRGEFRGKIDNILDKALALAYAYAFTNNQKYARKAGIIIDRAADLYPDFSMKYWTCYGKDFWRYRLDGKACDGTWSSLNVIKYALIYGLIYDGIKNNTKFFNFLRKRAQQYNLPTPKGNFSNFTSNIENNIFACALESMKKIIIEGNPGFCSRGVLMMSLVARSNKIRRRLLDYLFSPTLEHKNKRNINKFHFLMGLDLGKEVTDLTRDGFSWEGGYGYMAILPKAHTRNLPALKMLLKNTKDTKIKSQLEFVVNILNSRLPQFYSNAYSSVNLDKYVVNFADSGTFGKNYIPYGASSADLLRAFIVLQNDELGKLYLATSKNGKSQSCMGEMLLDPFFKYKTFINKLEKLKAEKIKHGYSEQSANMTGRGFTFLRSGSDDYRRALAIYFGDTGGHNHNNMCDIYLFANDTDLSPGLGYPDLSRSIMRLGWNDNVISHNTVMVDQKVNFMGDANRHLKKNMYIGEQKLFAETPLASIVEIDGKRAYPHIKEFRRTLVLVNIDKKDFYAVDFFVVSGGNDHISSFHGNAGPITYEGIKLHKQKTGTYAGENIPFNQKEGNGLQFLYDVRRGCLKQKVSVEWQINNFLKNIKHGNKVRLRATALSYEPIQFALAEGQPPQNIPQNPKSITYMLRRKQGKNISTLFITVYESYLTGKRRIKDIRLLPKTNGNSFSAALEIIFKNGQKDIIAKCLNENDSASFDEEISLKGKMCIARYSSNNKLISSMISQASKISFPDNFNWIGKASENGKIVKFSKGINKYSSIELNKNINIPKQATRPLWTNIPSATKLVDASYLIKNIKNIADKCILDVQVNSFITCKNFIIPSFNKIKVSWQEVAKCLKRPNSYQKKLLKMMPELRITKKLPELFNKLLKSRELASDKQLKMFAKGFFAENARKRGINNLIDDDLIKYNYLIISAIFPSNIPAYEKIIYDFETGSECSIPLSYYIKK